DSLQHVRAALLAARQLIMASKMQRRPHFQPERTGACAEAIGYVDRVLQVGQENALLKGMIIDLVTPDRQARLQAKFLQVLDPVQLQRTLLMFGGAELDGLAVWQADAFGYIVQHHLAAQRRGQRGNEQAMIAARASSGNRARSVTTQAVGNQPFTLNQALVSCLRRIRPIHPANKALEVNELLHETIPPRQRRAAARWPPRRED